MTDAALDELERLADGATPGKWLESAGASISDVISRAVYIAAANPVTVKALIAEVRRLRDELARTDLITIAAHEHCCDMRAKQERERCAKIAEGFCDQCQGGCVDPGARIAVKIREGGK